MEMNPNSIKTIKIEPHSNRTITVKQLIDILIENHFENAVLLPYSHSSNVELLLNNDTVVIINSHVEREIDQDFAYICGYNYPLNWNDLDDDILKRSIRHHYSYVCAIDDNYLTDKEAIEQGLVLYDDLPLSKIRFVPLKIYDIINEIWREDSECY